MTHVTCRLTGKNRDQLRNPTLGNRVWATLPFLGRSGLVVSASDCGVRGPRFESHRGRLCLSRQLLRYTALGTGCAPLLHRLGRLSLPPRARKRVVALLDFARIMLSLLLLFLMRFPVIEFIE